jgi:hypothetical protein
MARGTPTVVGLTLVLAAGDGEGREVAVGSDEWRAWLGSARCFAFEEGGLRLTAQPRRRGQRRYWYAYARVGASVKSVYLGRDTEVSLDRLRAALGRLSAGRGKGGPASSAEPALAGELLASAEARLRSARRLSALDSRRLIALGRELADQVAEARRQAEAAALELDRLRWELREAGRAGPPPSSDGREVF